MPLNTSAIVVQQWSENLSDFILNLIWSCLPSVLLYGLVGLLISTAIMVWVTKKKLLRRRPRLWSVLAKLSYVLILAGTLFATVTFGVVRHVQLEAVSAFESRGVPVVRSYGMVLRDYVSSVLAVYAPGRKITVRELVDTALNDLYYRPESDSSLELGKARIVNWTLSTLGRDVLTTVFQKLIIDKVEAMAVTLKSDVRSFAQGEAAGFGADLLTKVLLDADRKLDLMVLSRTLPEIVVDAVRQQIRTYFTNAYMAIALIWLVIAAMVVGEMLLYFRWYEKNGLRAEAQTH